MAEHICQMCGKENPAGQDQCQHCGARLTPMRGSPPESPGAQDLTPTSESTSPPEEELDRDELFSDFEDEEDDQLGWLDELRGEGDQPDQAAGEEAGGDWFLEEEEKEEEVETDWLERIKRLDEAEGAEEIRPEPLEDERPESDFPSWMTEELGAASAQASDEGQEGSDDLEDDLPEWLQLETDELDMYEASREEDAGGGLLGDFQDLLESEPEASKPAPQDEVRQDEVRQDEVRQDAPQERPPDPEPPSAETDLPPEEPEPKEAEPGAEEPTSTFPTWAKEETPTSLKPGEGLDEIPEDLRFLSGMEEEETEPEEAVDPFDIGLEDEEELFDDLFDEDLPSWLTSAVDDDQAYSSEADISPGDLPGWVEAMKPVVEETGRTGMTDEEEYVENYGPLAGISSIIPAEPDIESAAKGDTTQSSLSLSVSQAQRDYAQLLERVLARENKVQRHKTPTPAPTQRILRWLITLVLLVTLGGGIIFGGGPQEQPPRDSQGSTAGHAALYQRIQALNEGDPVLVAFDYQPALAGEFSYTASAVINHLFDQGAYPSLISTQPTGPALAEQFLDHARGKDPLQHGLQYINLGYLPGGSAGLLSFTIQPQSIIPLAFDGSNAWESPPLQGVSQINDFALILILTDDPSTAKIWIEQVQTVSVADMGLVVSAQVEPLIQPYYHNTPQQISGYVSGLLGGYAYEGLRGEAQTASAAWLPFNLGIIITAATIFIGGLANGIHALYQDQKAARRGEE